MPAERAPMRKIREALRLKHALDLSERLIAISVGVSRSTVAEYGYGRFCDLYRDWRKTVSATMRQTHAAGEKLFVDWAGDTVPVFDAATGMERHAHIFVAVLGASNYTYAEARWSEALPEWVGAHVNAFTAIAGVPGAVVCDNLKAGVTATCRYEPGINRTYQDLATHYDTAILPTRPRKPRDKAKVEVGVLIIERYVLARLRNRRLFSLFELNAAIREIVAALNARIMRKLGVSRLELLETVERPALKELPSEPYQYAEWKKCRVAPDYHVEVERHYYSVPSRLIREQVEARITPCSWIMTRALEAGALRRDYSKPKEVNMHWDTAEGDWKQFSGKVKEQWGKLTADEITQINGDREQLEGKIQARYGYAKYKAKQEVDAWCSNRM